MSESKAKKNKATSYAYQVSIWIENVVLFMQERFLLSWVQWVPQNHQFYCSDTKAGLPEHFLTCLGLDQILPRHTNKIILQNNYYRSSNFFPNTLELSSNQFSGPSWALKLG